MYWFWRASALVVAASVGGWLLGDSTIAQGPTIASSESSSSACNIKGNVSQRSGERIYHMPGQKDYAATRISAEYGERWFCSEAEARQAGWRKAGR